MGYEERQLPNSGEKNENIEKWWILNNITTNATSSPISLVLKYIVEIDILNNSFNITGGVRKY
jgi:hypothetical protein